MSTVVCGPYLLALCVCKETLVKRLMADLSVFIDTEDSR